MPFWIWTYLTGPAEMPHHREAEQHAAYRCSEDWYRDILHLVHRSLDLLIPELTLGAQHQLSIMQAGSEEPVSNLRYSP
jgi:hypothetical protein